MLETAHSFLFVPGHRHDRFDKALSAGAHAVVIDLEDAVPDGDKDRARERLMAWLRPDHRVVVRINAAATPWFAADLELAAMPGVAGIMLPKTETTRDPQTLAEIRADLQVLPLIESAVGFSRIDEIAATPGVTRLVFGSIDFQLDMGMDCTEEELLYYRSRFVLSSRLAGIAAPIDGVTLAIEDPAALAADARRACRLGFGGKLCIHPKQIPAVNQAFMPTAEAIAWARQVIEADRKSGGAAVSIDNRMVDKPVVLRARAILAAAAEPND